MSHMLTILRTKLNKFNSNSIQFKYLYSTYTTTVHRYENKDGLQNTHIYTYKYIQPLHLHKKFYIHLMKQEENKIRKMYRNISATQTRG